MTTLPNAPTVILAFVRKIFTFENGILPVMAAVPAWSFQQFMEMLFRNIELRTAAIPIVVAAVCMALYFLVFITDFVTGVKASKKESPGDPNWFRSDKGWSSIWKIGVIYLIVFSLTALSLLSLLVGLESLSDIFNYCIIFLGIAAMLLDIHSIGENHKRMFGKKPAIFNWFDNVYKAFNELVMKKIQNLF